MSFEVYKSPVIEAFGSWVKRGIYNATSVLSGFMGVELKHSEPQIMLVSVDDLKHGLEGCEKTASVCMLQQLIGVLKGFILFAAPPVVISRFIESMAPMIPGRDLQCVSELALAQSVINEWANIFAGNVISSIESQDVGIIELTSTEQAYDMSGAALDFVACQMGISTDMVVLCHSRLQIAMSKEAMDIWIVLSPDSLVFAKSKNLKGYNA
jgi:chemotaxis protein CheY-P-specific phosphatase CheC